MKVKTVKQVLKAVRWILKHKGWCQGVYARNANGTPCWTNSPTAACFCLSGVFSVIEADGRLRSKAWNFLNAHIVNSDEGTSIVGFNDAKQRTKEEVLALLDDVIKEAP